VFRKYLLPIIVFLFYRLLVWSWRIRVVEHPELTKKVKANEPVAFAHWHGDELSLVHLVKVYKLSTMTSTSKDGQLIDFVIRGFGGSTSKGSSTRGGVQALKGLIRLCRSGRNCSLAVDGPKGPLHQVKHGILDISRMTGHPIVPTGVAVEKAHTFHKSWNKTFLPLPFTKVLIYLGEPSPAIPKKSSKENYPQLALDLAKRIHAAGQQAAKLIAE